MKQPEEKSGRRPEDDGAEVIESAEASAPFKLQFERVVQKSPVYTDDKVPIEWIDVKIKVQVLTNKKS